MKRRNLADDNERPTKMLREAQRSAIQASEDNEIKQLKLLEMKWRLDLDEANAGKQEAEEQFWILVDLYLTGQRLCSKAHLPHWPEPAVKVGQSPTGICCGCFGAVAVLIFRGFGKYPVLRKNDWKPGIKLNDRDWLPPMCRACADLFKMKRTYHRNVQVMFLEHGSIYITLHEQVGLSIPIMRIIVDSLYAIKHV